MPPKNQ